MVAPVFVVVLLVLSVLSVLASSAPLLEPLWAKEAGVVVVVDKALPTGVLITGVVVFKSATMELIA